MGVLIHAVAHGLSAGDEFRFGNLIGGAGIDETASYFVIAAGLGTDDFEFSDTLGGAAFTYTTDITDGILVDPSTYTVIDDGVMSPPDPPAKATSLALTSSTALDADGHAVTSLHVALVQPTSATLRHTIVSVQGPAGDPVKVVIPVGQTTGDIAHVLSNASYSATAESFDTFGQTSGATTPAVTHTTSYDVTAPSTPTGLAVVGVIQGIVATWTAVAAADLSYYEVALSSNGGSTYPTTYKSKTNLSVIGNLTAGTYYVKVRAVDLTGNASAYCAALHDDARNVAYADLAASVTGPITTAEADAVAAQGTANTALANAATAQADATTALGTLTNIASDSLLTPNEKQPVIIDYANILGEQSGIDAQATAYGVTTTKTNYDAAVTALTSYLGGLTSAVAWNNTSGNTTVVAATFRTKFEDVYSTRQLLLNAIYAAAQALAATAQSTANTAVANAATAQSTANGKNTSFYQTSAPTAIAVNDLWFDTDDGYALYVWSGSSWVASALGNSAIATLDAGKITTGILSADRIDAQSITAGKLATTLVLASVIKTAVAGSRIEEDIAGLRAYNAAGLLILNVPTNGDPIYVAANIVVNNLLNTGSATFDLYDQGGAVVLAPGTSIYVSDATGIVPTHAPSVVAGWVHSYDAGGVTFADPAITNYKIGQGYYDAAGGASGATACFVALVRDNDAGTSYVYEWKISDGTIDRITTLAADVVVAGSITRIGANWYTCTGTGVLFGGTFVAEFVRATGAVVVARTSVTARFYASNAEGYPIKTDGTNLWIAGAAGANLLRIVKFNSSLTYTSTQAITAPALVAPATDRDIYLSHFEIKPSGTTCFIGISTYHGSTYDTNRIYEFTMSTGVVVSSTDFPDPASPYSDHEGSLIWNGTNFFTYHTAAASNQIYWSRISNFAGSLVNPYWAAYAWYDSAGTTHESVTSPSASAVMDRGKALLVYITQTLPGAGGADDPNNVRVYALYSATEPAAGAFKLQTTANSSVFALESYASGGAADGGGTVFPPASGPAEILSGDTLSWVLYGNGLRHYEGSSFPGSPSANDHYWRSDLGMEFYYDGTRWVSAQLFVAALGGTTAAAVLAATTNNTGWAPADLHGGTDLWIVETISHFFVNTGGTALGASHKWVATIDKVNVAAITTIATASLASGANGGRRIITAVGALSGTADGFRYNVTKTGTPGSTFCSSTINYRVVTT